LKQEKKDLLASDITYRHQKMEISQMKVRRGSVQPRKTSGRRGVCILIDENRQGRKGGHGPAKSHLQGETAAPN